MTFGNEFWKWVDVNIKANPEELRLKYHGKSVPEVDIDAAIRQVECRQRFGKKLAQTLSANPHFLFPTELSGEQSTSDALAAWHASLLPEGARMIDLTAGLGIDAMHCAQRCSSVTAIERNPDVAEELRLNAPDIKVQCADCRELIADYSAEPFDVAFIDPARRAADGARVFDIADCEPNVLQMLPDISRIAKRLIIKLSPMLDISRTLSAIPNVTSIIAVGTATECKELVADVDFTVTSPTPPLIRAVTIGKTDISFKLEEEAAAHAVFAAPEAGMWLYEPYPSVMKAGCYNLLSARYGVQAVAPNTHIYLSPTPVADFPGGEWRVSETLPFASKHIKRLSARYPLLDVATRNFPLPAAALVAKLKVRPTSSPRLLALTTSASEPLMVIMEKS